MKKNNSNPDLNSGAPVSVVILTGNEELNIENCLKSVYGWADEIVVVDSYSADKTLEIAKRYGVKIFQHPFENQARQFNWALDNAKIKNNWIFRLDADEYLTEELKNEITEKLKNAPDGVSGFYIKRRVYFMNRWIKHGAYYPIYFLRLFKKGKARSEDREVDEHIVLTEGESQKLKNDFIDERIQTLEWWTGKQNNHSTREVMAILRESKNIIQPKLFGTPTEKRRWIKEKIFRRLPLFFRSFAFFIYRYFFRLGFLDGKEGLIFHFLSGLWYPFLVDAKFYEREKLYER
ncbi:glycosyltransferase family 2 protein [Candidatus Wolfebacteria bacterium]|nr:glycosyltransferase family 2 protein [Candidatus Wolfebacteria bacterium]